MYKYKKRGNNFANLFLYLLYFYLLNHSSAKLYRFNFFQLPVILSNKIDKLATKLYIIYFLQFSLNETFTVIGEDRCLSIDTRVSEQVESRSMKTIGAHARSLPYLPIPGSTSCRMTKYVACPWHFYTGKHAQHKRARLPSLFSREERTRGRRGGCFYGRQ